MYGVSSCLCFATLLLLTHNSWQLVSDVSHEPERNQSTTNEPPSSLTHISASPEICSNIKQCSEDTKQGDISDHSIGMTTPQLVVTEDLEEIITPIKTLGAEVISVRNILKSASLRKIQAAQKGNDPHLQVAVTELIWQKSAPKPEDIISTPTVQIQTSLDQRINDSRFSILSNTQVNASSSHSQQSDESDERPEFSTTDGDEQSTEPEDGVIVQTEGVDSYSRTATDENITLRIVEETTNNGANYSDFDDVAQSKIDDAVALIENESTSTTHQEIVDKTNIYDQMNETSSDPSVITSVINVELGFDNRVKLNVSEGFATVPTGKKRNDEEEIELESASDVDDLVETQLDSGMKAWGDAWNSHVYILGSSFVVLSLCSLLNLTKMSSHTHLLERPHFICLALLVMSTAVCRSLYLLIDPYNLSVKLPAFIANLLFSLPAQLLTSAFAISFLSLLRATRVQMLKPHFQSDSSLAFIIISQLTFCVSVNVIIRLTRGTLLLLAVSIFVSIVWAVALSLAYWYNFHTMYRSAQRLHTEALRRTVTKLQMEGGVLPRRLPQPIITRAVLLTLVVSVLSAVLATLQLFDIVWVHDLLGVFDGADMSRRRPWIWLGFQTLMRLVELMLGVLMLYTGGQSVRPHDSPPANNCWPTWSSTRAWRVLRGAGASLRPAPLIDYDRYPAVCNYNQVVQVSLQ